ncbi:Malonyl CoA-acyl carrier protein transacylase [Aquisphaera giovannonii]|uniref:Malonyl CoA-acyl carrier protein transacylase n=1 Tax=Aquisphaera giovannonii TaxID=406548 RepID=A0A5B9VV78_9BACT|nr:ACP S-malonyltransferase [Aquisphaera giovannonii]QEH32346.1 Malonyl CoA-acyl carrier protein transacylase [Aquisphaera giovannonii]
MPKIAFLFPGQGAQAVGMCKELDAELPAVRELFDRANEVLGFDLRALCFEGPADALEATDVSQPAIFVASLAALESLKATDPAAVEACAGAAGLSLGEYTAHVFAGTMDFASGLEVVRRRGQAMQAASLATPSGMTSVLGLDEAKADELCRLAAPHGRLWKANMLGPGNIVVSGEAAALAAVPALAEGLGAMKVVPLSVAGAFHSEIMKPADEQLAEVLSRADLKAPRIPVYSNVDARPHSDPEEIRGTLVTQVLHGVRWEESMRNMMADGFDAFYEIGPGRVLTALLKRIDRKTPCTHIPAR